MASPSMFIACYRRRSIIWPSIPSPRWHGCVSIFRPNACTWRSRTAALGYPPAGVRGCGGVSAWWPCVSAPSCFAVRSSFYARRKAVPWSGWMSLSPQWAPPNDPCERSAARSSDDSPGMPGPDDIRMSEISVLLVDDHSLVRKGFRRMLDDDPEIRVIGEAADGTEAVKLAQELKPRVIVMDMAMPGLNGMQASIEILKVLPSTAILMLSMYSEENYVRNALEAGAKGYILKNAMDIDLAAAIKQVAAGQKVIAPGLLSSTPEPDAEDGKLTNREKQILQLIAEGKSNKEIAALLDLSVNTVSVHRANLMEALGIHRTAELVLYAVRKGLVHIP